MSEYVPTVGELRQAYVEASGATMAQESYYAEQVAEFERGIARIKAEALREALSKVDEELDARLPGGGLRIGLERAGNIISNMADQIEEEAGL